MIEGSRLGRYQILKHLAQGGMAEVLLARSTGLEGFERHVVIKRIRGEQARDDKFVKMFLDEARLAASLHHQNVVQVHDIGEHEGEYFFAMEYVHGEDLRKVLRRASELKQKVPLEYVLAIASAAAAGLHHAHERTGPNHQPLGIVHRDVSPANILVGYDGSVKVADFGIAKATLAQTETRSGTLKGKVSYMSPEQCRGKPVDRRSDVFALGIVLYELVTVRRLFKSDNDFMTMSAIVHGDLPRPSLHRPDIPSALEEIIMRALAQQPGNRYQTADDMRQALDSFALDLSLHASTNSLAEYVKQLFGGREEPWLVENLEPQPELGADFDGSASGMVPPPEDADSPARMVTDPGAPIVAARTRATTNTPLAQLVSASAITGAEKTNATTAVRGSAFSEPTPSTGSGEPLAWSAESELPRPRRRGWIAILAAALVVTAAAIVIAKRGPDETTSAKEPPAPIAEPQAPPPEAPKPEPPKPEPPRPDKVPETVVAAPVVVPVDAGVVAVDEPHVPAKPTAKVVEPKVPKKPPPPKKPPVTPPKPGDAEWDPNALFPRN